MHIIIFLIIIQDKHITIYERAGIHQLSSFPPSKCPILPSSLFNEVHTHYKANFSCNV
ncbi:hypothetical protein HanRHA438_Chr13g0591471 [Helianthus annuus]|nr:hypothetical protein HanRHA438_Chr13g0591471 [Helianthus annuus]